MRFFEFSETQPLDKFINTLRNLVGRASSKKAPANMNWAALDKMVQANGFELAMDYETFKSVYDSNPAIQQLVKNFNSDGIELNVPGSPESEKEQSPQDKGQTSQDAVDQTAATAAAGQLAQSQTTPQV